MNSCSLSILVARTDIPFMMQTIPHLVKMCQFDFVERTLVIDTAPLSKNYSQRPGIGSQEQLQDCCEKLLAMGVVNHLAQIDYSPAYRQRVYQKHFGFDLRMTHNYRGYPILGSIFALESAQGDYVLHFDSDMLLYQSPHYNWIEAGMAVLRDRPEVLFVSPLSGPPSVDGRLQQRQVSYEHDAAGFYAFRDFTSRKFLVDRRKLEQVLPIDPVWLSWKRRLWSRLTGESALLNWEIMISNCLKQKGYLRADLDAPGAWTLHTPDHGAGFIAALSQVIERVESGNYPPEQAGDYDLQLEAWV
jgi:hypothetical protein